RLFSWLGYEGEYKSQQRNFKKLLDNNRIPYEEIQHNDSRFLEHPVIIKEVANTNPKVLHQKKWLVMSVRNFKKAVLRLNTKNGEMVRDYYINLEEASFEYGQYISEQKDLRQRAKLIAVEEEKLLAIKNLRIKDEELETKEKEYKKELEIKDNQLKRAERKALNVHKFMNQITIKEQKLEWIYIGTTEQYARDRIFKIGSTTRLANRIPQYNTGRIKTDNFYYAWAMKCFNAKDVDYYIQKLLSDFKYRDPNQAIEGNSKIEMYHGIKFSDLTDILKFIVENYDQSVEFINNFIKIRLSESLEEEDEIPPALDLKKITYLIGDHEEVIDVEKENEREFKKELKNIMRYFKDQQARGDKTDGVIIVERTELVSRLSQFIGESKTRLWNRIKELTGWKKSTMELVQSESESEESGPSGPGRKSDAFKYKIMYNKTDLR
ncbi:MAG: GIY-YIG nuclease family protein, partial [Cetobacterium sp.]